MSININDVNSIYTYGQAVITNGLVVQDAVNGYGLETFGFLWQAPEIWIKTTDALNLSTQWNLQTFGVTSSTWNPQAIGPTTTNWTVSEFGIFGEVPPILE